MKLTLLTFLFLSLHQLQSKTVFVELTITRGTAAPDGFTRNLLLVNGQFPGPQITAQKGDYLELTVHNQFNDGISIHLHGINQYKTPFYDGTVGFSQSQIEPQSSFKIRTNLTHSGTYFYHAHHKNYDTTVFGALIVKDNRYKPEREHVLILNDWWHVEPEEQFKGLLGVPFKWIGDAFSTLTNGIAPCNLNDTSTCVSGSVNKKSIFEVEKGKTYRLRIICASSLSYYGFAIAGHKMTIIEVDGISVVPVEVDTLELNSGQRFSVLVKANQPPMDYVMDAKIRYRLSGPQNGQSILRYKSYYTQNKVSSPPTISAETPGWITQNFRQRKSDFPSTEPANQTLTFAGAQSKDDKGYIKWTLNDIASIHPESEPIISFALNNSLHLLPPASQPIQINTGEIVDLVMQNKVALNGICEEHPWHLHGHSFWVLGQGEGTYTPSIHQVSLNLIDPVKRDTVTLYPYSSMYNQPKLPPLTDCGWSYLRVLFDNPGVWPFHCHIIAHFAMGMSTTFVVGNSDEIRALIPV